MLGVLAQYIGCVSKQLNRKRKALEKFEARSNANSKKRQLRK
jgi:hypothetical protein